VKEKKYTEDHEWIEASADGKTCMFDRLTCLYYLSASYAIAWQQWR